MRVYEALTMLFQIMINKNQLMSSKIVNIIQGDCQKTRAMTRDMTWWLRALADLPEDIGSISCTHMATHNYL